jgi:hypothetical protein
LRALTPVIATRPQGARLLQRLDALLVLLEGQTRLRKNIGAAQVLRLRALVLGVVVGGLVPAEAKIAQRQQVRCIGAAGLEGMQAAGEKEGVFGEAVVEVVVYELPQLGVDTRGRRRHGGQLWCGGRGERAGVRWARWCVHGRLVMGAGDAMAARRRVEGVSR